MPILQDEMNRVKARVDGLILTPYNTNKLNHLAA